MSSGKTAQDKAWKDREQAEEAQYVHAKEQQQLAAIRESVKTEEEEKQKSKESKQSEESKSELDHDFEGGFGGQEALEDRYATTLGEH